MWLLSWPVAPADAAQYTDLIKGSTPTQICVTLSDWATLEKGE
jgi:hypothetical protein